MGCSGSREDDNVLADFIPEDHFDSAQLEILKRSFDLYDVNNDNVVKMKEVQKIQDEVERRAGTIMSDKPEEFGTRQEAYKNWKEADVNHDGKVNWKEFCNMHVKTIAKIPEDIRKEYQDQGAPPQAIEMQVTLAKQVHWLLMKFEVNLLGDEMTDEEACMNFEMMMQQTMMMMMGGMMGMMGMGMGMGPGGPGQGGPPPECQQQ